MEGLINDTAGIEDRIHGHHKEKSIIAAEDQFLQDQQRQYFLDLFQRNKSTPINVSRVVVNGSETVRDDVLRNYLQATVYKASTFEQLCKYSDWFHYKMVGNGLAESVTQSLDSQGNFPVRISARDYGAVNYSSAPECLSIIDVVPIIQLHPIKRFSAKTGTNIGNGEGDGYIQFQFRNIFNGGEKLTFDATKGTKTHSSYLLNYFHPMASPWWVSDSTIYKNSRQLGNCELMVRGIGSSLKSGFYHDGAINHEWRWES